MARRGGAATALGISTWHAAAGPRPLPAAIRPRNVAPSRRARSAQVRRQRKIWWHGGATTSHWPDDWAVSMMPDGRDAAPWLLRELRELPSPRVAARLIGWDDAAVVDALPSLNDLGPLFAEWHSEFAPPPGDAPPPLADVVDDDPMNSSGHHDPMSSPVCTSAEEVCVA